MKNNGKTPVDKVALWEWPARAGRPVRFGCTNARELYQALPRVAVDSARHGHPAAIYGDVDVEVPKRDLLMYRI